MEIDKVIDYSFALFALYVIYKKIEELKQTIQKLIDKLEDRLIY